MNVKFVSILCAKAHMGINELLQSGVANVVADHPYQTTSETMTWQISTWQTRGSKWRGSVRLDE